MARTSTRVSTQELQNQLSPDVQAKLAEKVERDINPNLNLSSNTGYFSINHADSAGQNFFMTVQKMFTRPSDIPEVTHSFFIAYGKDQSLTIHVEARDSKFRVMQGISDGTRLSELDENLNKIIVNTILNAITENDVKAESSTTHDPLPDASMFELAPE